MFLYQITNIKQSSNIGVLPLQHFFFHPSKPYTYFYSLINSGLQTIAPHTLLVKHFSASIPKRHMVIYKVSPCAISLIYSLHCKIYSKIDLKTEFAKNTKRNYYFLPMPHWIGLHTPWETLYHRKTGINALNPRSQIMNRIFRNVL